MVSLFSIVVAALTASSAAVGLSDRGDIAFAVPIDHETVAPQSATDVLGHSHRRIDTVAPVAADVIGHSHYVYDAAAVIPRSVTGHSHRLNAETDSVYGNAVQTETVQGRAVPAAFVN
ncbi:hypothetical protein BD413DRAFT_492459 [Trametes elegans]|nr:hypothetical protein BD413DRAFT_492459 [Trametes elegans]